MAVRSLTESYLFMRNNALQNKQYYSDQLTSDHEALVSKKNETNIELGVTNSTLPPEWVHGVDEIQYEFSRVKQKMKELIALHDRHLTRASLDDNVDEDEAIERQTKELTQLFGRCHTMLRNLSSGRRTLRGAEAKMSDNVKCSLARTLQDLSTAFRKAQSHYLKRLKQRDERLSGFDIPQDFMTSQEDADGLAEYHVHGFQSLMSQVVETNTAAVAQRESEITQILQSMQELNDIFRDLAQLVVDQGTIIDRIDYNIEKTHGSVKEGLKQLQKAEKHQKKNRKMIIIVILAVIVIGLSIGLVFKLFSK